MQEGRPPQWVAPAQAKHLSLSVLTARWLMGPSSPSSSLGSSVMIGQEPPVVVVLAVMSQPWTSEVLVVLQLDFEPGTGEQETQ